MNIIQIVPHVGNEASGPSYTCVRLSQTIAEQDHDVILLSVKDGLLPSAGRFRHDVYPKAAFPSALWRSPQLYEALIQHAKSADIVHSNSLWVMPNVYPGWVTRRADKPLVISPRGTLSDWAWGRSRLKKGLFWSVLQGAVVKQAALLHATCEAEYQDIKARGLKQPVCIIPNGVDVPEVPLSPVSKPKQRRLLFLGRVHPVKGVDTLLRAWGVVAARYPDWELEIVGPDNVGYLEKMKVLAAQLKLQRVTFQGPLYGAEKLKAYQKAELYVLPTHSENFGVTVAEALAAGTPAVVTQGAPWAALEQHNAGWWIEIGLDPLVACLEEALAYSSEQLALMGAAGRRWMQDDFSWERIADSMLATYQWLLSGGKTPVWVRID